MVHRKLGKVRYVTKLAVAATIGKDGTVTPTGRRGHLPFNVCDAGLVRLDKVPWERSDVADARSVKGLEDFLWRPILSDPKDDMVLELGIASQAQAIVTYNQRDFLEAAGRFSLEILTPSAFLHHLGD